MEPVYDSVIALARGLFAAQGLRFTITGEENVPRSGGAVMVVNHTGYLDFTYAGLAVLRAKRVVRFLAKESVFTHPVSGPLMRAMRHIPVDRTAGAASYAAAVDALRAGEIVGVFPEATISRSFELKDFKSGAARMAAQAGVPILPVVIWGSQRVWTKGHPRRLGRTRVPILLSVGQPITVAAEEDPVEVTSRYKAVMADLLGMLRAAYEPLTGADLKFLPASLGGTAPTLAEATRMDEAEAAERRLRADERRSREHGTPA
ncbi:MAG TPA: lysophospholipid acyltransferase family protein [Intrasporangium sp.]|uniref:lysophospholipid acyltransferase family protein n=1 Tax=Intrasporangium sp. TaxID=1925024 RepID=UPI002D77054A|nr:lysophospholipid acyltransferase family protein [Intrasporangium sp.]HET7398287.1 lysophospholipid acyltransferase family protein [Intrasporangium sp.]